MVLNNVRNVAYAAQAVLNLLDSWSKGNEADRQAIPRLIGLTTPTKEGVQLAGNNIAYVTKIGFCMTAQSQIENSLRNVSRELGLNNSAGFYRLAEALVLNVGLPSDRVERLNVAAMIRNSLHDNGMHRGHRGQDSVITLGGVVYEFRDGQRVECADWEHIAHALETSIDVLEEIFNSAAVSSLGPPIMDKYAWDKLTVP